MKPRKYLRKRSARGKLIQKCKNLLRTILKIKRGDKCEICGRRAGNLGLFHILPEGLYKRLALNEFNLLLACWLPCHFRWHRHRSEYPYIEQRVKQLRGEDYYDQLLFKNFSAPRMTMFQLDLIYHGLRQELKGLK